MTAALFDRVAVVTVSTLRLQGFRVQFKVDKSSRPEPNTLDLVISNLNADHRGKLTELAGPGGTVKAGNAYGANRVVVVAGYVGTAEMIFQGDARSIIHRREGADWTTRIHCGDGERRYVNARSYESFAPGTRLHTILLKAARDLDVGLGNVLEAVGPTTPAEFARGFTLAGHTASELNHLMAKLGLTWSIQDGQLQVLGPDQVTHETAVELGPRTGLIGSPELGEKGIVKFSSLLQPGLRPGRAVLLRAASFKGFFRLEKVTHQGDTHGQDWTSTCEARPVPALNTGTTAA